MKININIDTDQETTEEALEFLHGPDYKKVVQEIDGEMRTLYKYDESLSNETLEVIQSLRTFLSKSIEDNIGLEVL